MHLCCRQNVYLFVSCIDDKCIDKMHLLSFARLFEIDQKFSFAAFLDFAMDLAYMLGVGQDFEMWLCFQEENNPSPKDKVFQLIIVQYLIFFHLILFQYLIFSSADKSNPSNVGIELWRNSNSCQDCCIAQENAEDRKYHICYYGPLGLTI